MHGEGPRHLLGARQLAGEPLDARRQLLLLAARLRKGCLSGVMEGARANAVAGSSCLEAAAVAIAFG